MKKEEGNGLKSKLKQYLIYPLIYALVSTFFWYYNGTRYYIPFKQHMYKLIELILIYLMLCLLIDFLLRMVLKYKGKNKVKKK